MSVRIGDNLTIAATVLLDEAKRSSFSDETVESAFKRLE
jgi:hypothetical protein